MLTNWRITNSYKETKEEILSEFVDQVLKRRQIIRVCIKPVSTEHQDNTESKR